MTATQTTTDQNLAAAAAYWSTQPPQPDDNPGPTDYILEPCAPEPGDAEMVEEVDAEEGWTDADERAFADEPLWLSGPARYSGPEPCEVCAAGGELPCEECGAVANGELYD